jgi:hypothetical protein
MDNSPIPAGKYAAGVASVYSPVEKHLSCPKKIIADRK